MTMPLSNPILRYRLYYKKADISVQDKYAELDELSDKSINKEG